MRPPSLEDLQKLIQAVSATSAEEISTRFVVFPDMKKPPNLSCSFFLIKCTAQEQREKDLADFMVDKIVRYVLRREQIFRAEDNPDLHSRNFRMAKSKFIQTRGSREPGELLLFLLLESRGIVQVLSKIALKTSPHMYYHGVDGVHIEVSRNVILHLGSSKMMKDFNQAVSDSLSDMENHAKSIERQNTELYLLSSYIDESKFGPFTDFIKSIVDPYSTDRQKFGEAYSMLVCSDWEFLKKPYMVADGESLEEHLAKQFLGQHQEMFEKISKRCSSYPKVSGKPLNFYIVPFANVTAFCELFSEVLKN